MKFKFKLMFALKFAQTIAILAIALAPLRGFAQNQPPAVPGDVWIWIATGAAIPNSPGVATLTGSVKYGTTTTTTKTTVVLQ
jgi:hypothetical protein